MTTALYIVAAVLSWRFHKRFDHPHLGPRSIWRFFACTLFLLAINKEMDIHVYVVQVVDRLGQSNGFSNHLFLSRRIFFFGLLLAVATTMAITFERWVKFTIHYPMASVGYTLIALFAILRAAAMTRVDELAGLHLDKFPGLWLLEPFGATLIIVQLFCLERRRIAMRRFSE
jgi:hypothetical protein